MASPITYLLVFTAVIILLVVLFYPKGGIYWRLKNSFKNDSKTLIEDILKKLYHAEDGGNSLSTNDIISSTNIRPKKIIETIAQMEANQLINFNNGTIKLTENGMDYALRIIRVHRLWEKYLSEKTGFDKNTGKFDSEMFYNNEYYLAKKYHKLLMNEHLFIYLQPEINIKTYGTKNR